LIDEREAETVGIFRKRIDAIFDDLGDAGYAAYRPDERWRGAGGGTRRRRGASWLKAARLGERPPT